MNYVAYDFETANSQRTSACALGAVKMENGKEVDSFYTVINPEEEFCGYNVMIHGISADIVRTAPKFVEVSNQFIEFVGDYPIVSHTYFDRSVLVSANNKYNNKFSPLKYFDSFQLSKAIWANQKFKFG
ncbi:exonuclease domain-containing protein [Hutsoniella sourekii]